jgi:integrase/recombinase XerC
MLQNFLDYLQYEKRYSTLTILAYQTDLEQFQNFLISEFDNTSLEKAHHNQIRAWIVQLSLKQTQASSLKRKVSALKSFYKYLLKKNIVAINPASKIVTPKMQERLPKFIEQKNLNNLLDEENAPFFGEDYIGKQEKLIIETLYQTGMRRAELMNLEWTNIDFHQQQIKITGKGNKQRIVPSSVYLLQQLQDFRKLQIETFEQLQTNYVFLTENQQQLYPNYVYRVVRKYLNMCTTSDKKSPHVLRHSFATHLSNNGAKLNDIKELMGHASLASTQVYTHNTIEQLKEIYKNAHPKA